MNPSAYAVWRALVKSELLMLKNHFFKLPIAGKIGVVLYLAFIVILAAGMAGSTIVAQFTWTLKPADVDEKMGQIVLGSAGIFLLILFLSLFTAGMGSLKLTDISTLAPLPVHRGALYFHRIARLFTPFLLAFLIFIPAVRLAAARFPVNLFQEAVYYLGWLGLCAFCAGLTMAAAALMSRFFGVSKSKKAYTAISCLFAAAYTIAIFNMDQLTDAVQSGFNANPYLYSALPSTWAALALKDPFPIWQLAALTALGAGGILLGYAVFVRAFDMEEALKMIEMKGNTGQYKSSARMSGAFAALLRKDMKLFLRNRKFLGGAVFMLCLGAAWVSISFLEDVERTASILNSYAIFASFAMLLSMPMLEGRGILSARMAMPNLRAFAAAKSVEFSTFLFLYAIAALSVKTRAFPNGGDILNAALIGIGYANYIVGMWCAFPRLDEKKPIGLSGFVLLLLISAPSAVAFGMTAAAAHVSIAAAVCASGLLMLNYGRKRLESMDALW